MVLMSGDIQDILAGKLEWELAFQELFFPPFKGQLSHNIGYILFDNSLFKSEDNGKTS